MGGLLPNLVVFSVGRWSDTVVRHRGWRIELGLAPPVLLPEPQGIPSGGDVVWAAALKIFCLETDLRRTTRCDSRSPTYQEHKEFRSPPQPGLISSLGNPESCRVR